MAILEKPTANGNIFADQLGDTIAPPGTYVATVLDVSDEFQIQRQKYQSTELETVDLTTFLFCFQDAQGIQHRVASRRMRISGHEKSALFGFLKGLLGHAPEYGWDYCLLKEKQCLLTVDHVHRQDGSGVFARIASLAPLPDGLGTPKASTRPLEGGMIPKGVSPAPADSPEEVAGEDPIPF